MIEPFARCYRVGAFGLRLYLKLNWQNARRFHAVLMLGRGEWLRDVTVLSPRSGRLRVIYYARSKSGAVTWRKWP